MNESLPGSPITSSFDSPLFCVPHTSHWIYALRPAFGSSRLPQSVQKTREPIAAMLTGSLDCLVTRPTSSKASGVPDFCAVKSVDAKVKCQTGEPGMAAEILARRAFAGSAALGPRLGGKFDGDEVGGQTSSYVRITTLHDYTALGVHIGAVDDMARALCNSEDL